MFVVETRKSSSCERPLCIQWNSDGIRNGIIIKMQNVENAYPFRLFRMSETTPDFTDLNTSVGMVVLAKSDLHRHRNFFPEGWMRKAKSPHLSPTAIRCAFTRRRKQMFAIGRSYLLCGTTWLWVCVISYRKLSCTFGRLVTSTEKYLSSSLSSIRTSVVFIKKANLVLSIWIIFFEKHSIQSNYGKRR